MAANEYSRRSSKDVFWGDDDNKKKDSKSDELEELFRQSEALEQQEEQTPPPHAPAPEPPQAPVPEPAHPTGDTVPIFDFDSLLANGDEPLQAETPRPTPPPYKPSKKSKKVSVTRDDFNIDKFISDNSDGISEITTSKTISIVIWIGVALLVAWWLRRWVAAIVLCFLGYTITKSTINSKYKKFKSHYPMTTYLSNLIKRSETPNYRYSQIVIEAADAVRVDNFSIIGDGRYVATAHILQHFMGYSSDGRRVQYEDYTAKTITIYIRN